MSGNSYEGIYYCTLNNPIIVNLDLYNLVAVLDSSANSIQNKKLHLIFQKHNASNDFEKDLLSYWLIDF